MPASDVTPEACISRMTVQGAPNAHSRDAQGRSDVGRPLTTLSHLSHLIDWHGRLTAPIGSTLLCSLDTRPLPLQDEPALHLGNHAQHGYQYAASIGGCAELRFEHAEPSALLL